MNYNRTKAGSKYRSQAEIEKEMREDPNFAEYFKGLDALAKRAQDAAELKQKQDEFLKELGIKLTFEDIISLLKDEVRLKKVVSKLKLKAFW